MALSKLTDIRKSLSVEVEDLQVNGITTFTGSVSIGGTLTYQDVTNVDSVGIITAQAGINVSGGTGTFAGDVLIADKIVHTGDTNTTIRFPAVDTASVETSGAEALRIDSSGRLIVGSVSSNNVGAFGGAALQVEGLNAATSAFSIIRHSADTVGSSILMGKTRGTSDGATTVVQSGDVVARIIAYGADGTDTESSLGAIQFDVDGTPGSDDMPGRIVFSTTPDGAATYTERLRITNTGRINIGDTDQTQNVDQLSVTVAAQNAIDNVARFQSNAAASGTSETRVKIYKGAGYGGVLSGYITQGSDHGLKFYTADSGTLSERLRINSSGQVIMTNASTTEFIAVNSTNNNTRGTISMQGKNSSGAVVTLRMGGFGDTGRGEIFTHSNHDLGFATNNAAAQWKMKTGGDLEIGDGNLVVASGHGIDFSAAGNAGAMTSELLDDYEEGSWAPDIKGRTGGSFSIQVGQYTKVGRMVSCTCHVNISSLTSSNGAFVVNGLPFTSANVGNNYSVTSSVHFNNSFSIGGDRGMFNGLLGANTNEIAFYYKNAATITAVAASDFGSGNILFEITYHAT